MSIYPASTLFIRVFMGLIAGFSLGYCFGQGLLGVTGALALMLVWSLARIVHLLRWLEQAAIKELDPPESHGLWGAIFDGIYRVQKYRRSSRDRLKEVVERIQESTAALDDGIVMLDRFGNLEWWNRAAEDFLALKSPDDQGQLITNLVRDPLFTEHINKHAHKEAIEITSPGKGDRDLQVNTTLYGAGNRLLLIRDITRLNQLEIMRKDFVANVSHELRTPLTVIAGYLETLIDASEEQADVPPMWRKALLRMDEQSQRMQNLVADLLLLSRLESVANDHPEPVDLKSLLEKIVTDTQSLSGEHQHQISLDCESGVCIEGNKNELRSALSNLAFNAVRYTPAGGRIQIRFKKTKQGGKVVVEDDGVGIEPVHIPRLTERFYRIDKGRSLCTGGTGLGLAIVKHVLLRHDATLSIKSFPGKGSRFTCHFPSSRIKLLSTL
ncbi:phosphate regulon sensor histidine kinase PhoR [Candidatus Sororendozoicomonas aggregata]|uniref:phosphate regulon sensor histidine kinase PhoR n=1 Tax=Candidatus Sororendozoicomonas aggregata TaxID=3073239 RepID=UPI002ED1141D